MTASHTVKILPEGLDVRVADGDDLLGALVFAGIRVSAACGGQGTCGRCRVIVREGDAPMESASPLTDTDIANGVRLACRTRVRENISIEVPVTSRVRALALSDTNDRITAQKLFEEEDIAARFAGAGHDPLFRAIHFDLPQPSLSDSTCDFSRIARAAKAAEGINIVDSELSAIAAIPKILRDSNWNATAYIWNVCAARHTSDFDEHGYRLTALRPGRTDALALVVDVGTTTVKTQLIDAASRTVLAEASEYNRQIPFGEDVISRILVANKGRGLKKLQAAVVETINALLTLLLKKTGRAREDLAAVFMAGNPTMTHLLLGVPPRHLREAPYVPVANAFPPFRARVDAGIDVPPGAYLHSFPGVASYVGGDITAGVLAAGIHRSPKLTLYIDIGTNGEIVVGNEEWLLTAACSAGPAFEGGGLRCGTRAAEGAIEGFWLDPDTREPSLLTIGHGKPGGVCGSGVIAVLAELLARGVLAPNGKLNPDDPRVRPCNDGLEFILARAADTSTGKDITLTEADCDNILRAKAAMYAGYKCLLGHAGVAFSQLDRVIITGAFGSFIDLEKAVAIGLLPELPRDRFFYLPNGALLGARLGSCSAALYREVDDVARMMTHVELSEDPRFMDEYMAAMFLPHTHAEEFPDVSKRLADCRKAAHA
jgi:uncharacterized 2Fe-2S/4Fe-4S cluster protein (DUF4445 family)